MKTIILTISLIAVCGNFNPQEFQEIYGYVNDIYGNPIKDVKITSQEKYSKTFTNKKGWYFLKVPATDTIVYFLHQDYENYTIQHTGASRFDVQLTPNKHSMIVVDDKEEMDEVAVVGYGKKSKHSLTGAVAPAIRGSNMALLCIAPGSVNTPDWNTESYAAVQENGFKNTMINPLSTFSIDVDNASYSNVRRFINEGRLPDIGAVRVEEMINYFNYDYPEPTGEHPFSVTAELSVCPWNKGHQLLHVGLQGKKIDVSELPSSNLVFLLDVSGSMDQYNKLPLVKKAFRLLVNELRPNDKVSIVVYAGAAGLVLEPTPGNQKTKILQAIENLQAGGSTSGGEGIKLAYKTAGENFIKGGNNRIILATDGDFNVGVSSNSEMQKLVENERDNGIFITVLGFGMGNYKDDKMEIIADKGNGNYAYIDNFQEARKVFISEFGGTLFTIAKDVKFQLEFNPQYVKAYRLVGYENRLLNDEDFNDDTKDAGEMGAGHTVTALYEIISANSSETIASVDPLKYRKDSTTKFTDELVTIKLRYKEPDQLKSKLFEKTVSCNPLDIQKSSDNFRFSAAVAGFGMLLKGSEFKGSINIDTILKLAQEAKGTDSEGYRAEFIQLVKTVRDLNFFAMD